MYLLDFLSMYHKCKVHGTCQNKRNENITFKAGFVTAAKKRRPTWVSNGLFFIRYRSQGPTTYRTDGKQLFSRKMPYLCGKFVIQQFSFQWNIKSLSQPRCNLENTEGTATSYSQLFPNYHGPSLGLSVYTSIALNTEHVRYTTVTLI